MRHYVGDSKGDQLPRIVTVGMGKLGGMVIRQVRRTIKNAECVLLENRDEIAPEFPALGKMARGADCIFIVVDPLDAVARNTANWLARNMKAGGALVTILTGETSLSANSGMNSCGHPSTERQNCLQIVVSPLCINPLPEDVIQRFGTEMLAAYLIRHFIEIISRWVTETSIVCIDFTDIKTIIENGGINRLGVGMSINGDADDAAQKAIQSLTRQGVDLVICQGVLGCVSGSTNLTMDDFNRASEVLHRGVNKGALVVQGILTHDALGRAQKVTLLATGLDAHPT